MSIKKWLKKNTVPPTLSLRWALNAVRCPFGNKFGFREELLRCMYTCPNGIYRMSPDIDQLVQSPSNNLARVLVKDGTLTVMCSTRSSVDSEKMDLANAVRSSFELCNASVKFNRCFIPAGLPKRSPKLWGRWKRFIKTCTETRPCKRGSRRVGVWHSGHQLSCDADDFVWTEYTRSPLSWRMCADKFGTKILAVSAGGPSFICNRSRSGNFLQRGSALKRMNSGLKT